MSVELICSVLELPADGWPPADHYALLGLRPWEADAGRVEARVQELSARLRTYQLAYPDAVTDALNRLAGALVCLTDPAARAAYDAELGIIPLLPADEPPPRPAPPTATAEVADDRPMTVAPPVPREPAPLPLDRAPAAQPRRGDPERRWLYRQTTVARHLLQSWREAERFLADPDYRLRDRVDAAALVRTLSRLRDLAADDAAPPVAAAGQAGHLVVALARQPRLLHDYRRLPPEHRLAVAADWRAGFAKLADDVRMLRWRVRRHRHGALRRWAARTARYAVSDGLDVTLFVLGLAALGVALLRSR
jgi:hypothetical protein